MKTIDPQRINAFFSRFPLLLPTISKLNAAQIPFAIGGSGCLFLFGNERLPDDVDIYLLDNKHDEADRIFGIESFTYRSETENVRNSNPEGDHSMQLTSRLVLNIEGKTYKLSLTGDVLEHGARYEYQGHNVCLLPVEEVLLIKALLQRGPEVKKHDVEDIQRFLLVHAEIDNFYLKSRIDILGAGERIGTIFTKPLRTS